MKAKESTGYSYSNSGTVYNSTQKLEEVKQAVRDIEIPYFRLAHVEWRVDQSRGAIWSHLQELKERGEVLKVGTEYVDVEAVREDWSLNQIKKLKEAIRNPDWEEGKTQETERPGELQQAQRLQELYQEKKELAREQFEELKEELSDRGKKQEIDRLQDIQRSLDYYKEKAEYLKNAEKLVTRLYFGKIKEQESVNSEKSEQVDCYREPEPNMATA